MRLSKLLLVLSIFATGTHAETITVVSWGGAYEQSQAKAYFAPFTEQTGIEINIDQYNGGIEELSTQASAVNGPWDLLDMLIADNIQACERGLLQKIDHRMLADAPDGTVAEKDFIPGTLTDCGVGQIVSSNVIAYHDDAFPAEKPARVHDFFNVDQYPGKRGLQKKPIAILEWALLSYDVPIDDLYSLLSTERGLRLAFSQLDKIRDYIVWWEDGSEPAQLLSTQEVVMTSGYNGRFFDAAVNQNQPIEIIWHGQLLNYSTWGIPTNAPHSELAREFVRFSTSTRRLSDQAKYIAYGPVRYSSTKTIRKHKQSGIDIRPHLPTYLPHLKHAIVKDHEWYARTQTRINELFHRWLSDGFSE